MSEARSTDHRASMELDAQVGEACRKRRDSAVQLLQQLIRVPSVNPWFSPGEHVGGEAAVQDILTARLTPLGAEIDRWEPNAAELERYAGRPGYQAGRDFSGRPNMVARLPGTGGGRSLLVLGHADVVSAGEGWTVAPFSAVRRDGAIYGRGAVDMKGGMAAAITAVEALADLGVRLAGDVLIGSVVDEEAGGMGALALIDRGYRADGAIIPEPSNLNVAPLCRGILWGRVTIAGRSGHIEIAQPDWRSGGAVDAISIARRLLDAIDELNTEWSASPSKRHPLLPLPCQIKVAMVESGSYPTAYADAAQITFDAQYLPAERDASGVGGRVKAEIATFLAEWARDDPWLREHPPLIEWLVDADCAETPAGDPLVRTLQAAVAASGGQGRLEGMSSHTDMGLLVDAGIPTVNFGPGAPSVAHQADEHVTEQHLLDAATTLAIAFLTWCGPEGEAQ